MYRRAGRRIVRHPIVAANVSKRIMRLPVFVGNPGRRTSGTTHMTSRSRTDAAGNAALRLLQSFYRIGRHRVASETLSQALFAPSVGTIDSPSVLSASLPRSARLKENVPTTRGHGFGRSGEALGPGQPGYRARQSTKPFTTVRPRTWWRSPRCLPGLRQQLAERHALGLPTVERLFESTDGTRRYLLRLVDGRTVETVLMPEASATPSASRARWAVRWTASSA